MSYNVQFYQTILELLWGNNCNMFPRGETDIYTKFCEHNMIHNVLFDKLLWPYFCKYPILLEN